MQRLVLPCICKVANVDEALLTKTIRNELELFQNNFQTETILHAHDLSPLTPEPYTRQLWCGLDE